MLTPPHPGCQDISPSLGFSSRLRPCQTATPARLVQRSRNDANQRQLANSSCFWFPSEPV